MRAINLANYIINKSIDSKKPVSNLQLQKMIYFVNLYYFRLTGAFLLDGEQFEAWQHGPVIPEVYREYATYGGLLIKDKKNSINLDSMIDSKQNKIEKGTVDLINDFILYLSKMDPWTLVDYSHRTGGAWYKAYNKDKIKVKISNELIKQEANSK
ncbi:Panacea domain-containing protein [Aliarcobacter lanthieri]|uniref:Panacea domain-containing protein n=1 Tax=Aliarcobacter lanthieri TaxID=1355374 RepID=UPI003AA9C436